MDKVGIRTIVVNFDDEQLPYLSLVQGDAKTRGFDIVICDSDGKEIPPNNDYIVELVATGSSAPDKPYANRHTIKDGKYRVMIPTEVLSESGFVFLQLVFYQKSTGAVIHTIEQKCPVYRSRGQEVVESNNLYVDITALRLGIERIDELDKRYTSMLSEENTRQDAEKKRNEHEANRIRDEKTRESNETIRKSQELSRKSAEDKRVTAEEERKANEAQRQKYKLVAGANVQIDGATNIISAVDTITTINGKTGAISKADIVALGVPSQDTNTTYSEITTAEIDTGTASTLRTITGRRVKYILDKIQGWIGNLTKADVGLNNVDNVKQATKVEFDSHDTNTTIHITNTERTNWNTKETTTGSQDKANQAEQNAKSYVDGKVLTDVPINAKFTDTVYSHPSSHPASMITESSTKRFVSDSEKSTWNSKSDTDTVTTINGKTGAISKADITALGIPSQDTVYKKPLSEPISYIQGLQAELDSRVESYGTNPVLNITVINAGGSTTSIPNNTLILELE